MKQLSFIQLSDTHLRSNYINDPFEREMVNYTDRHSYNTYTIREQEIFSKTIYVNPNEKVIWALTNEENERYTIEHYGK